MILGGDFAWVLGGYNQIPRTRPRALVRLGSTLTRFTPAAYQGRGLRPRLLPHGMGELILRHASHLDAFSGYHCPTWLPSGAPGGTTGTPAVGPPRSSRTRGSSPQLSYAHSG